MEATVYRLKCNNDGGHTHLRKNLQRWLREAYLVRKLITPNPARWEKLVELVQYMWESSMLMTELRWTILFLIPKVNVDT